MGRRSHPGWDDAGQWVVVVGGCRCAGSWWTYVTPLSSHLIIDLTWAGLSSTAELSLVTGRAKMTLALTTGHTSVISETVTWSRPTQHTLRWDYVSTIQEYHSDFPSWENQDSSERKASTCQTQFHPHLNHLPQQRQIPPVTGSKTSMQDTILWTRQHQSGRSPTTPILWTAVASRSMKIMKTCFNQEKSFIILLPLITESLPDLCLRITGDKLCIYNWK